MGKDTAILTPNQEHLGQKPKGQNILRCPCSALPTTPFLGAASNPPGSNSTCSEVERFLGHLLTEDLEPAHGEFQTQRPENQGATNCGLLLFPACSPICPPPYASSSHWPLPLLTPSPYSAGQGGAGGTKHGPQRQKVKVGTCSAILSCVILGNSLDFSGTPSSPCKTRYLNSFVPSFVYLCIYSCMCSMVMEIKVLLKHIPYG